MMLHTYARSSSVVVVGIEYYYVDSSDIKKSAKMAVVIIWYGLLNCHLRIPMNKIYICK